MSTTLGVVQDNLPAGWRKDWSSQYHTNYYVNIYTGESSWKLPLESVYGDTKPSQNVSGAVNEILDTQQREIQTSPGGPKSSPALVSTASAQQAAQESYFPQQIHVQTAINPPHETVPVLFFPPPPSSSQSQTIEVANQAAAQKLPPPPALPQGQTLIYQSEHNTTPQYFPPPPPISQQFSGSSQLQINFPPPPPRPETIVHPQAGDLAQTPQAIVSTHLQGRPAPPSSRPRPRSFIGQMEMIKIHISDQSQIYGAKAMETKLGSKVSGKVGKFIPTKTGSGIKETDPLLDTEATPPITNEEKKLWDDRTEEEKKASYKKWGKRAAIGAGVVAAVVIGAEAIEHASNANDAFGGIGSAGHKLSLGTNAMSTAMDTSNTAAMNAARQALADAELNAAMLRAAAFH